MSWLGWVILAVPVVFLVLVALLDDPVESCTVRYGGAEVTITRRPGESAEHWGIRCGLLRSEFAE